MEVRGSIIALSMSSQENLRVVPQDRLEYRIIGVFMKAAQASKFDAEAADKRSITVQVLFKLSTQ
jgi:hypothetical protein